jgi:hypothetical protein
MALPRPVPPTGPKPLTVYATSENIRKYIRHPSAITNFDANGRAVWPDNQFTRRRINDGDVTLEAPEKGAHKRAEHKA